MVHNRADADDAGWQHRALGQLATDQSTSSSWFRSSEHCSTSAMQSFGWSVSASQGIRCDRDASGIRGSSFWSYPGDGKISIPLPMGFSIFTITYGQSCYAHGSYVLLKLNGAVVSGAGITWFCAWGTIKRDACFVFPPVAGIPTWTSCLKTVSVSYTPGDVLELIEVNSIAYIRSISLS